MQIIIKRDKNLVIMLHLSGFGVANFAESGVIQLQALKYGIDNSCERKSEWKN